MATFSDIAVTAETIQIAKAKPQKAVDEVSTWTKMWRIKYLISIPGLT